jgi:hypothetical protein
MRGGQREHRQADQRRVDPERGAGGRAVLQRQQPLAERRAPDGHHRQVQEREHDAEEHERRRWVSTPGTSTASTGTDPVRRC